MAPDGLTPPAAPWRLRISDPRQQRILGAGFPIAPQLALTCWHVVADQSDIWVDAGGPAGWRGLAHSDQPGSHGSPGADVAVLRLARSAPDGPAAPMGPAESPPTGTVLLAFGFPQFGRTPAARPSATAENPGIWTRVVAEGFDHHAERVWLTSQSPQSLPVQRGFSGGPVLDPRTGLVVGMTAVAADRQPVALMIPVATLAACDPQLRRILLPDTIADPDFTQAIETLGAGNYAAALAGFRAVCSRRPEMPDTWYYVALAALRGQRPRDHTTAYIKEIDQLLGHVTSPARPAPHSRSPGAHPRRPSPFPGPDDGSLGRGTAAPGRRPSAPGTPPRYAGTSRPRKRGPGSNYTAGA